MPAIAAPPASAATPTTFDIEAAAPCTPPKGLALKFTKKSKHGQDRLEDEPVTTFETGAPVLDAAVAWVECRVVGQQQPGDHVVFFGEVIGGEARDGAATTLAATGMSYAG